MTIATKRRKLYTSYNFRSSPPNNFAMSNEDIKNQISNQSKTIRLNYNNIINKSLNAVQSRIA